MGGAALIGREELCEELVHSLKQTASGRGGLVLLAGEAGVGKTRLATELLQGSSLLTLTATASPATATPFGLLVAVLRAFLRLVPDGLPMDDGVERFLPVLLPELGVSSGELDRATVFEVVRSAFVSIARREPTIVFIDDLQEADYATLDALLFMAETIAELPLLLLAAYRSDELRRDHPLRRLRTGLRRAGRLRELPVGPLGPAETSQLAERILGRPASPPLAAILYERTDGLPLLIEELVGAVVAAGRLQERNGSWELVDPAALLPVPDTVRDLVLLRATRLSETARSALEIAAVAGKRFDLDLVAELASGESALEEAFAHGLLIETEAGIAAFRHELIRDAFYTDITWPRRRALHRAVAGQLERRGAAPVMLAEHWLAGREPDRARRALLLAAEAACGSHAYRDAANLAHRALELWPEDELEVERLTTLDRFAECAQMSADLPAATTAWRKVAQSHERAGRTGQHADAERRLAGAYELPGAWEQGLVARRAAATSFAANGQLGDAAAERLAAATHLRSAARFGEAIELLGLAAGEAHQAGRVDLQARILGLLALLAFGAAKARFTGVPMLRGAIQTAAVGGIAAGVAYALARLVSQWAA